MRSLSEYHALVADYLKSNQKETEPNSLYEPIRYILELGGKRLRPILALMSAEIFGADPKNALDAAMSVELFHNFSLIHDDIMDDAPLRRGRQTVHEKWDLNTGILSGDAMLIQAGRCLESYEPHVFKELMVLFNTTAIEVCEGQQYDIDFESRDDVKEEEYLKMIAYKTAVLVGAALKMGAIVAGASSEQKDGIYKFGLFLGTAFQLQDDYLDAFGDPKTFGKQVGGDILEHKKTFLYLKTLELASSETSQQFLQLMADETLDPEKKVDSVKEIYESTGAKERTIQAVKGYTEKAFSVLEQIGLSDIQKNTLIQFGEQLMNRKV